MRLSLQNRLSFAILLTVFIPFTYWSRLQGVEFPTHFSLFTGIPDRLGVREDIFILMGVAVAVYVMMLFCCRFPQLMNYPTFSTKVDKEKLFPLGIDLAQRMNYLMMLIFSLTTNCSALMAIGVMERFPVYLMWITLLFLFVAVIRFVIQVRRVVR